MNRKILEVLFFAVFVCCAAFGQQINRDPAFMITGSGFLNTRSVEPELEGKTTLFSDFRKGTIYFRPQNRPYQFSSSVNFDVYTNRVLISLEGRTMELEGNKVDSVVFSIGADSTITLKNSSILEGIKPFGFFLELYKGHRYKLIKVFSIEVIKPTYNELMNVGSRNYSIKESNRYFIQDEKSKEFRKFQIKRTSFANLDSENKYKKVIRESSLDGDYEIVRLMRIID